MAPLDKAVKSLQQQILKQVKPVGLNSSITGEDHCLRLNCSRKFQLKISTASMTKVQKILLCPI